MQKLNLSHKDFIKQYRRMVFNVLAKNCDDHTKNISFLMNQKGEWSLSPAYDITFSYNPNNYWINQHQMSVNGKRKNITIQDLETIGEAYEIRNRKTIIKEVKEAISHWRKIAEEIKIDEKRIKWIESNLIT
jgi:serine/threonine-protein kinase HipA